MSRTRSLEVNSLRKDACSATELEQKEALEIFFVRTFVLIANGGLVVTFLSSILSIGIHEIPLSFRKTLTTPQHYFIFKNKYVDIYGTEFVEYVSSTNNVWIALKTHITNAPHMAV